MTAIRYALRHPDRIASLVLFGVVARAEDANSAEEMAQLARMVRTNWERASRTLAGMNLQRSSEMAARLADDLAALGDGETALLES